MDFIRDMELISREVLDFYGVDYSSAKSGWEIVRIYMNVKSKLITQVPRNVEKSGKIQRASYSEAIMKSLSEIERKFLKGEDVNPHQSTKIFRDGTYPDPLLRDWRICHLHLSTELDQRDKRFMRRSRDVLFVTISGDTVHFVDVRPHGPSGEKNVFEQKDLLQTIADEWPWVLEPDMIKGARIRVEDEVNDP
jgi:hypothetical protein